jgi:adenylate cyclase
MAERPRTRLQDRVVVFFVVLLMGVQLASFLFIRYAIEQTAQNTLLEELRVGTRVFRRVLDQANHQRVDAASVLTYDYGFRAAIASRDRDTILSALRNHGARIKADGMTVVGLDGRVVADTAPDAGGGTYAHPELLARAAQMGRATGIRVIGGTAYQLVVVPVMAPLQIGTVSMRFAIDDREARDLQMLTSSDVSFLRRDGGGAQLLATTLPPSRRAAMAREAPRLLAEGQEGVAIKLEGEAYEALVTRIENEPHAIYAVLQRSVSEGIAPYLALQAALLVIAALSLLVTLVGSIRIAQRITRPVAQLAHAAREIARGNYGVQVGGDSGDEMGELAQAFNGMAMGLAERDNVRDVLGKVASFDVVNQLLEKRIELGGQELDASVMFTDLRNFTALCENLTPRQSLAFLNEFLTEISAVVEEYGGVVDKYVGDGVMALFGAPVTRPDDVQRAVEAAIEIRDRIDLLRPKLAERGMPSPEIGIGLNTARVVAGNVGSATRLNYTVLGDGVNLASRLEGLTKRYHEPIVVGSRTHDGVAGIVFRELDKVRVRGRQVPERIYEPLAREGVLSEEALDRLNRWHDALALFRSRRFESAEQIFKRLGTTPGYERLCSLYMGYLRTLAADPPDETWEWAFTLYDK